MGILTARHWVASSCLSFWGWLNLPGKVPVISASTGWSAALSPALPGREGTGQRHMGVGGYTGIRAEDSGAHVYCSDP